MQDDGDPKMYGCEVRHRNMYAIIGLNKRAFHLRIKQSRAEGCE